MQHIKLSKVSGVRHTSHSPKRYTPLRNGQQAGTLKQRLDLTQRRVLGSYGTEPSRHATTKAATRVSAKVLA